MVQLGYKVPEPLARELQQLKDISGISLQKATAAAILHFTRLGAVERDNLLKSTARWLDDLARPGAAASPAAGGPPPDPSAMAAAKGRAARRAFDQERARAERKARQRSG